MPNGLLSRRIGLSVLFIAIGVFLFPELVFQGKVFIGSTDRYISQGPHLYLLADALKDNRLPEWNSYSFCGIRGLGDAGAAVLYPPNLFLTKFFPSHLMLGASWRVLLELIFSLIAGYLFFLKVWKNRDLALFSSVAYSLSHAMMEQVSGGLVPSCFLPLILYFLWDWESRPMSRNILYLSLAFYLHIATCYPQLSAYYLVFVCLLAALRCLGRHGMKSAPMRRLFILLAVSITSAIMLDVMEIVPMLEAQHLSNRLFMPYSSALSTFGQPVFLILRILIPFSLGDYTNFPVINNSPNINVYEAFPAYAGVLTFVFSLVALAGFRRRDVFPWIITLCFLILAALKTPFHMIPWLLFMKAPLYHGRIAMLVPLCMAFLAPTGINLFLESSKKFQLRCAIILGAASTVLFLFFAGWLGGHLSLEGMLSNIPMVFPPSPMSLSARIFESAVWFLLLSYALVFLMGMTSFGEVPPAAFRRVCLILLIIDVAFLARAHGLRRVFADESSVYPRSAVTDFLDRQPDKDEYHTNIALWTPWASSLFGGAFYYSLHMAYRLHDINGYGMFLIDRYNRLVSQGRGDLMRSLYWGDVDSAQMADLLAVKYFIMQDNQNLLDKYLEFANPVFRRDGTVILSKRRPLSRFRLACRARKVESLESMLTAINSGSEPLADVIYVEPDAPLHGEWASCRRDPYAANSVKETAPGRIEGNVDSAVPALLMITESYDRGWRAYVNGKRVKLLRANYAFQSLELPAGKTHVRIIYHSPNLFWTLPCTLFGLFFVVFLVFYSFSGEELFGGARICSSRRKPTT